MDGLCDGQMERQMDEVWRTSKQYPSVVSGRYLWQASKIIDKTCQDTSGYYNVHLFQVPDQAKYKFEYRSEK